jgi:hypothetical protein
MRIFRLVILSASLLVSIGAHAAPASAAKARPRLLLVLVFDQMRADYLLRFESRFLPARTAGGGVGGFRYLMSEGSYYPYAEYGHLQDMTCPGHAALLNGTLPYASGIATNRWWDYSRHKYVYCAEDAEFPTVGATPKNEHVGTSPRAMIGSSLGDELKLSGYPSKVISVALKDRSAIMMGGKSADLALWLDGDSMNWVSSRYYLRDGKLPEWMARINQAMAARKGQKVPWNPGGKPTGYNTDLTKGGKLALTGEYGKLDTYAYPFGQQLTAEMAETVLDTYKLGQGKDATDLLAVSFSSFDYVGHDFGPNSPEMEEMIVSADRMVSRVLNHVRKRLPGGLKDVVVALSADHGVAPLPEWVKSLRTDTGRIDENAARETVEARLRDRFGSTGNDRGWIEYLYDLHVYLSREAAEKNKIPLGSLIEEARAGFAAIPGVAYIVTSTDLAANRLLPGLAGKQAQQGYFEGRSGDLLLMPKPFWMTSGDGTEHITGYTYDRMVPLILAGAGVRAGGARPERAAIVDLAPTLAFLARVLPPALSEGRVLSEALLTK